MPLDPPGGELTEQAALRAATNGFGLRCHAGFLRSRKTDYLHNRACWHPPDELSSRPFIELVKTSFRYALPSDVRPQGLKGVRQIVEAGYNKVLAIVDPVVNFDASAIGADVSRHFKIRNSGARSLNIRGISITGSMSEDYHVDSTQLARSLAPGEEGLLSVTFNPSSAGSRYATLHVLSNDPDAPSFDIRLSGEGGVPPSGLQSWRYAWFGVLGSTGEAADDADPNHNGIPNLLEYALGGDPIGLVDGASILPTPYWGPNGLELRFEYAAYREGVTLTVQAADNPGGPWTDVAECVDGRLFEIDPNSPQSQNSRDGDFYSAAISDVIRIGDPFHPIRFMRLKASSN